MSEEVDKILEVVNSQEFKDQQAAQTTAAIKRAVEVQQVSPEDLGEAKKGGRVHGDPIFTVGRQ